MIRLALISVIQVSLLMAGNLALAQDTARDSLSNKSDNSAQQAGMLSSAGSMFTMVGGIMMASSNPPTVLYGKWMVGLGVASFVAGTIRMSQSGDAQNASNSLIDNPNTDPCLAYGVCPQNTPPVAPQAPGAPDVAGNKPTNHNPESPLAGMARDDLDRLKNALEKAGIKTEADRQRAIAEGQAAGESLGVSDPMSGLSAAQKAQFESAMKAAAAKYGVSGVDMDGGGGMGGMAHGKGNSKDEIDYMALFRKPEDDRAPASAAGLTKNFNGDPIGVAADDIFKQITRRYDAKKKSGQFMSAANDANGPTPRKPNSLLGPVKQKRH